MDGRKIWRKRKKSTGTEKEGVRKYGPNKEG